MGSRRVTDLDLYVPPAGGWLATLHLDSGAPVAPSQVALTIGDLVLIGTVLPARGGLDSPDFPALVVAGGAGWRTPLTAGAFASPTGVRLSTVLAALAALAGEAYDAPADVSLGPSYGWDASSPRRTIRARAVLAELVARGAIPLWRVDPATGRTRFDVWPSIGPADAHGTVEDRGLARGVRHVALSGSVAAWLPGGTVQGVAIARTLYREKDGELRADVWTA